MTSLLVTWDYDPEDQVQRTATSDRFFAAWVNPFGIIEWTCTDEDTFPNETAAYSEAEEEDA